MYLLPYAGAAGIFLLMNGKLTIGKVSVTLEI